MEPSNDVSVLHIRWKRTRNQSTKYGDRSQQNGGASILRQVGGAFLPHPTLRRVPGSKTSACTLLRDNPLPVDSLPARLRMPPSFMLRLWRYSRPGQNHAAAQHKRRFRLGKKTRKTRVVSGVV
jgi:hypothetical protein